MNIFKYILSALSVAFILTSCKNEKAPEIKTVETEVAATHTPDPNATYAKAEFTVKGMTCAVGCAATIEKKIANMEGVKFAKVDFEKELAMVEYDEAKVTTNTIEQTVTNVADIYKVKNMKTVVNFSLQ